MQRKVVRESLSEFFGVGVANSLGVASFRFVFVSIPTTTPNGGKQKLQLNALNKRQQIWKAELKYFSQ